jgi:hypothetical protein
MTTVVRVNVKPNVGSIGALQELLTEWIDWRGGIGDSVALSRSVWAADGPSFNLVNVHDTIAEADEFRQNIGKEDRYWNMLTKLSDLISKPPSFTVLNSVIPANRSGAGKPVSISVTVPVAIGKIPQARDLLSEWVEGAQSNGMTAALMVKQWSADGPKFVVRTSYDSVADADEARRSLAESDDYKQFVQNLAPLVTGTAEWHVSEQIASANF